jgi:hypothetical protein
MESQKSELVSLLEEHINLDELIPHSFRVAFYGRMGRNHIYHLESLLWFVILKKLFGLSENTQLIRILKCSRELRDLCGFEKVPDASQITRFYQNYCEHIVYVLSYLSLDSPILWLYPWAYNRRLPAQQSHWHLTNRRVLRHPQYGSIIIPNLLSWPSHGCYP